MLVSSPGREGGVTLLDFFVEAPGRGIPPTQAAERSELIPVPVSFGDAVQTFHVGEASVGTFGMPAGVCEAARRFGRLPLEQLVAPAARLAREGVPLNPQQAYIVEILGAIVTSTPEAAALFAPDGRLLRAGERLRQPELGDALERLGAEGARPFYEGRHRRRHRRLAGRAGRPGDQGGPPRLRGGRPRPGACQLSRPRRAHQPAAVGRRDPHRPRPRSVGRGARRSVGRPAGGRNGEHPERADPGVPRRAGRPASSCARSWADGPAGWARPPTSPLWTATGGPARSPAPMARHPGSSCPAPVYTSTTCSASRTSTPWAFTATRRAGGCPA